MHRINSCSINLAKHKLNILCTNYVPTTIEVTLHLFPHKFFRQRSVKYLYLLQKQAFACWVWKFLNFLHCIWFQSQGWYYGIVLHWNLKTNGSFLCTLTWGDLKSLCSYSRFILTIIKRCVVGLISVRPTVSLSDTCTSRYALMCEWTRHSLDNSYIEKVFECNPLYLSCLGLFRLVCLGFFLFLY